MNLLFVHDHPFFQDIDKVYSGGGLPSDVWNNYLIKFNKVTVFGRKSLNSKDKKVVSSKDFVDFYLTSLYTSFPSLIKNQLLIRNELIELIHDADVVLIRLPSVLGFLAAHEAFKQKKPVWIEQVGSAKEALKNQGSLAGKIIAPLFEYFNKKIVKRADFISYVTMHKLQNDYPVKKDAITVALSDVVIQKILDQKEIDLERFFRETLKIGLIGGFDARYKGQDILLKAISNLPVNIKEFVKISFVGKGDYSWVLELAKKLGISDCIEFSGSLEPGLQINSFLRSLSLYVQPSLTEGMPRATIEAMAMGCPVIGSRVGGIPEIVSEKYIHDKGNIEELTRHILLLFNDRDELLKESNLSLQKSQSFLISSLNAKRIEFYEKIFLSVRRNSE